VLGALATAASAGVLAVLVPPVLLTIAAAGTTLLLDEIDALQSRIGGPGLRKPRSDRRPQETA